MRRTHLFLTASCIVLFALTSISAGPRRGWFGKDIRERLLRTITDEQKAELRKIGEDLAAKAKEYLEARGSAMKAAVEDFKGGLKKHWENLSPEQQAKAKELPKKMRTLSRRKRFAMGMRFLGYLNVPKVAADVAALIEAKTPEKRIQVGEKLLWHAMEVMGKFLAEELDLSDEQLASVRDEIKAVLDATRADRVALHNIVEAKIQEALDVLTDDQFAVIEEIKRKVLNICRAFQG